MHFLLKIYMHIFCWCFDVSRMYFSHYSKMWTSLILGGDAFVCLVYDLTRIILKFKPNHGHTPHIVKYNFIEFIWARKYQWCSRCKSFRKCANAVKQLSLVFVCNGQNLILHKSPIMQICILLKLSTGRKVLLQRKLQWLVFFAIKSQIKSL